MQYISTRNSSLRKSFSEVLLGGLAPDGGLYMPQQTLRFSMAQIENLNSLTYQEITTEILHQFVSDEINKKDFEDIVNNAYQVFDSKDVVNLVKLEEQRWILELFHGPTLAFKDVAMQLLGNFYEYYLNNQNEKINICLLYTSPSPRDA